MRLKLNKIRQQCPNFKNLSCYLQQNNFFNEILKLVYFQKFEKVIIEMEWLKKLAVEIKLAEKMNCNKNYIVYGNEKSRALGGWVGGWVDRWVDGRAVLRFAYSNQKS